MLINRTSLIIALFLCFGSTAFRGTNTANYIEKHKTLAIELMREFSIPASLILGVAVVESGAGTSVLSRKFHNHFGIVGKNFNAMSKLGRRSHYKEYESYEDSYRHFCEVVSRKKFYPSLRTNPDPADWISALQKSGYAVAASTWSNRVNQAIKKHNLTEIDFFLDPLNEIAQLEVTPK